VLEAECALTEAPDEGDTVGVGFVPADVVLMAPERPDQNRIS
jgi:hypothetical protein